MLKALPTLLICVLLGAAGQLSLKKGTIQLLNTVGPLSLQTLKSKPFDVFSNPFVLVGFALYFISSLLWLTLMSKYPLTLIYPMIALGYVFVVLGSMVLFGSKTNVFTWIALTFIVVGVSLLSKAPAN